MPSLKDALCTALLVGASGADTPAPLLRCLQQDGMQRVLYLLIQGQNGLFPADLIHRPCLDALTYLRELDDDHLLLRVAPLLSAAERAALVFMAHQLEPNRRWEALLLLVPCDVAHWTSLLNDAWTAAAALSANECAIAESYLIRYEQPGATALVKRVLDGLWNITDPLARVTATS